MKKDRENEGGVDRIFNGGEKKKEKKKKKIFFKSPSFSSFSFSFFSSRGSGLSYWRRISTRLS